MNRAYLRPPLPLFEALAACLAPVFIWAGTSIWSHHLPALQRIYFPEYVRVGLLPDVSGLAHVLDFGAKRRPAAVEIHVLICYTINRREVPATGWLDPMMHPHPTIIAMPRVQYAAWLGREIYDRRTAVQLLFRPLLLAVALWSVLLGWAWHLDQQRHLRFRSSGRQLRGPWLITPREFARRIQGNGIGFQVESRWGRSRMLRIARELETQHVQMIGDQGSGKTSSILHMTDEAEALGESCVIYDPHREFITRYYRPERGDIILNSTEARCAHWSPACEVDYTDQTSAEATALAQAASLYPGAPQRRDWFFTNAARLIWQHCMVHYRPDAQEMAQLMTHADPLIDAISKGTELEEMLKKNAEGQRAGIISTLTAPVFALRQVPEASEGRPTWSAREWAKHRRGWIFLTSTQDTRDALRPWQSLCIDSLILQLLSMGEQPGLPKVRMILDELPTLQELSQLKSALSEARKSGLTIIVGFQGRSRIRAIYGEEAEGIFSAPYSKLILRTGEADAAEWGSKMIGECEMERVREHRGPKQQRSYTTEQRIERVVMPSQLAGLEPRCGYLRYGNEIVKLKVALAPKRDPVAQGYIQRTGEGEPKVLPMPNLDEIRAKEEAERQKQAQKAAAFVYDPNQSATSKQPKRGPASQGGLWTRQP